MLRFYIPHRKEGEELVLVLRRHPIIIAVKLLFWATVAVMPLVFYAFARDVIPFIFENQYSYPIVVLFTSVYYMYIWLFTFHSFIDYYLDVWIVTNHRIINIEQDGLFSRTVSEQELYRLQDITAEVKGVLPTLLDFGTVYIQTAAEEPRFVFKQIPNPNACAKKITTLCEHSRKQHRIDEQAATKEANTKNTS